MTLRRFYRGLGVAAILMAIVGVGVGIYVARTWDRVWDAPLPAIHASTDQAMITRGEYLAYGPAHCVECHTSSNAEYHEALDRGERPVLRGGMPFAAPPLGVVYSANLTPDHDTGIGRYTDAQIARMLRWSVRPDGKASVQLLMPYANMSDDDIAAIISFLRAQPAVRHEVPRNEFTLIGKVVKSFAPVFKPRRTTDPLTVAPPPQPTPQRGEYLARTVANCVGCHTKRDPMSFVAVAAEFAGGQEMEPAQRAGADPGVWFRTPNLTPATGSAFSKFPDRETFVARFKHGGVHYAGSPMPWECFGQMSDADIGALWEYLRTLRPQPGPTGEPTFEKVVRGSAVAGQRKVSPNAGG